MSGGPQALTKKYLKVEDLKADIEKYFKWADDNPIVTKEFHGKDATECDINHQRPYTLEGLAKQLGMSRRTLYRYMVVENYEEFHKEVQIAKERITQQKIEYATVGVFNHNFTKFDLINNTEDYREKSESKIEVTELKIGFGAMDDEIQENE